MEITTEKDTTTFIICTKPECWPKNVGGDCHTHLKDN